LGGRGREEVNAASGPVDVRIGRAGKRLVLVESTLDLEQLRRLALVFGMSACGDHALACSTPIPRTAGLPAQGGASAADLDTRVRGSPLSGSVPRGRYTPSTAGQSSWAMMALATMG